MLLIPGVIASSYPKASGAFESIASVTASGSSNSVTFSSIPSTYQSLQLRIIASSLASGSYAAAIAVRFNSDNGSNYTIHSLRGGYTTGSYTSANGFASQTEGYLSYGGAPRAGNSADIVGATIADIHNYASTTQYKTVRSLSGYDTNGTGEVSLNSALWMSTSAITSITIYEVSFSSAFRSNSTFALYGIKGA